MNRKLLASLAGALVLVALVAFPALAEEESVRQTFSAFAVSTLFLASYLFHKASRSFENTTFNVEGAARSAYLVLLASHVLLAMAVPVHAILLIRFGLREEIARHRRLARVAWPIWMYVSVTGVVIYVLVYHLNPPAHV